MHRAGAPSLPTSFSGRQCSIYNPGCTSSNSKPSTGIMPCGIYAIDGTSSLNHYAMYSIDIQIKTGTRQLHLPCSILIHVAKLNRRNAQYSKNRYPPT